MVSREIEYMSVRVNFAFEKSEICIENSVKRKTSNYFSIQFSIENHLPNKERRQARSDSFEMTIVSREW